MTSAFEVVVASAGQKIHLGQRPPYRFTFWRLSQKRTVVNYP
jgi:hypothetical protein